MEKRKNFKNVLSGFLNSCIETNKSMEIIVHSQNKQINKGNRLEYKLISNNL